MTDEDDLKRIFELINDAVESETPVMSLRGVRETVREMEGISGEDEKVIDETIQKLIDSIRGKKEAEFKAETYEEMAEEEEEVTREEISGIVEEAEREVGRKPLEEERLEAILKSVFGRTIGGGGLGEQVGVREKREEIEKKKRLGNAECFFCEEKIKPSQMMVFYLEDKPAHQQCFNTFNWLKNLSGTYGEEAVEVWRRFVGSRDKAVELKQKGFDYFEKEFVGE